MPPRKKSKPAKYGNDDFLDGDDDELEPEDEDFDEDDEDDEPVKKRKPAKKKAAPKKETPAKKKPKKEDDRIATPHVAQEGPQWDLVPPSLLYRYGFACHGPVTVPWHVPYQEATDLCSILLLHKGAFIAHRKAPPTSSEKVAAFDFVRSPSPCLGMASPGACHGRADVMLM